MDHSRSLLLFIDELRYTLGYTISELTEGIISERTYRRYVHGITKVTQEDVFKFIERLGMTVVEFYGAYERFIAANE